MLLYISLLLYLSTKLTIGLANSVTYCLSVVVFVIIIIIIINMFTLLKRVFALLCSHGTTSLSLVVCYCILAAIFADCYC